ncbi:hypothetical protein SLA2020_505910 [Shorea laevis]
MGEVASSMGDTSAIMLVGQQNRQGHFDGATAEEDSVIGGLAEKQEGAEENIMGGSEGNTSKHLMCDGLEKDEEVMLETEMCRESFGNSQNFEKKKQMREIEVGEFLKMSNGQKN